MLGRPPKHQSNHTVAELSRNRHSSRGDVDKVMHLEVVGKGNSVTDSNVRHEVLQSWPVQLLDNVRDMASSPRTATCFVPLLEQSHVFRIRSLSYRVMN